MPDALVSAIEAAVGLACLIAAGATWRRPWWLSTLLAAAGLAAVAHAAIQLT